MRELEASEIALVDGGVAPLVVAAVVVGALGMAAIGAAVYGVSKGCSATAQVQETGVKVEIDCRATK